MKRTFWLISAATVSTGFLLASVHSQAQSAKTATVPTTYSTIAKPRPHDDMTTRIYRDGSREMVEMSRPRSSARPKGWISHIWYDFKAHREYADDSNAPGVCTVVKYTSDGPPEIQDPVTMAAGIAAEIGPNAKPVGKETLGGIKTTIVETPEAKAWIDETHHLAIKVELIHPGQPNQEMFDMTGISFAKPNPSLLTPPDHCTAQQGESNANGGHAVTHVSN